jgi:hypothetical protein
MTFRLRREREEDGQLHFLARKMKMQQSPSSPSSAFSLRGIVALPSAYIWFNLANNIAINRYVKDGAFSPNGLILEDSKISRRAVAK